MTAPRSGRARWGRGIVIGAVAIVAAAALPAGPSGADAVAGSAGTNTALPATESAVTVRGHGPFAAMEFGVNQTADLGNQAISVTWTGGRSTVRAGGADFAENFVQLMQCWSEPGATGPSPEQCVFGATDGVFGGRNERLFGSGSFADERVISRRDFENFVPADGHFEERTKWLWMPFRSVTGEIVDVHVDTAFSPSVESGNYWLNPLFNVITTNEIAGARTRADGSGEELIEVTTGLESSGLGCGQAVLARPDGTRAVPDCWLVIVPRGSAADENRDTVDGQIWEGGPAVMTSPLAPAAWANRITVPLDFNPIDTPCDLNADQRRIVGSELLLRAVSSWQPVLCGTPGLPPYAYASVGDASARLQLVSGAVGAPGMAVTSRPLPPNAARATNPITYAPLTLSAIVVGFNVERDPDVETAGPDTEALRGIRVAELNLTPRLAAKLLTQSYRQQTAIADQAPEGYEWSEDNPTHLDDDPDFLRFNQEFELLRAKAKNFGGLVLSAGTSDAARQVWEWILADPEARAWLDGEPDEWGMVVNPVYATTADANRNGVAFGDPVPDSFPKSDPHCYQAPPQGPGGRVVPPTLCGTDWFPYALTMRDAAQRTRAANDGARTTQDLGATSADRVWRPDGPQLAGNRAIMALVDSPTAVQYGLQTARLSRAGDDGDQRTFVAADAAAMVTAVDAMAASEGTNVLVPDPGSQPAGAYPLTTLTYAAVAPLTLDELGRAEYAAFVEYAAGEGQEAGLEIGQLPPGYTELPADLRAEAVAAAAAIRTATRPSGPSGPPSAPVSPPPAATAAPPAASSAPSASPSPRSPAAPPAVTPAGAPGAPVPADDASGTAPTTTAAPVGERGVTPISAVGRGRFVVPVIGAVALLAMLGALEITKRPRRAGNPASGASGVVVLVALVSSLAAAAVASTPDPAAAESPAPGEARVVSSDGAPLDGGTSGTDFTFDLSGDDECPGDSANDGYRIYSFMVPADLAVEDVVFQGNGPTPRAIGSHREFRMPLFDQVTTEFSAGFTAEQDAPGEPGPIVDLPLFSLGLYAPGELPLGRYRIGLVCTLLNEVRRSWDAEIEVLADPDDAAGFEWRVLDRASRTSSNGVGPALAVAALGVPVAFLLLRRLSDRSRTRPPMETR